MLTGYEFERAVISRKWNVYRDGTQIFPHDMKIGTNSVDVTLSPYFRTVNVNEGHPCIDPEYPQTMKCKDHVFNHLVINPGDFYLGRIRERFDTVNEIVTTNSIVPKKYVQMCHGRSTLGRLGIIVHCVAGFGDYGFPTHWTLEIANVGTAPVLLKAGMRIAQIAFEQADGSMGGRVYEGAYMETEIYPGIPNLGKDRV